MKKIYTTYEYKQKHKRKLLSLEVKYRKKKKNAFERLKLVKRQQELFKNYKINKRDITLPVYAPIDFRLIENTEQCLTFFRDIRSNENLIKQNNKKHVIISLTDVEKIDYATISVLTAISDDLKSKKINLQGDFPVNAECKKYIIESGFLNHMVDGRNRKFQSFGKSKLIFFEKGAGILSKQDSKKITELIKDSVEHLTGERKNIKMLKSVLLEICGNSIEHSKTKCKLWLLGVKYEDDKVCFTVTDVGKGILETLFITNFKIMSDLIRFKNKLQILEGAFEQKYGSSTQEENRNKGLPAVKACYKLGVIKNLIVLTNNVILHFDKNEKSNIFSLGKPRFKGTIYQWELTKESIVNSINCNYEN